ncbi:hypothetical protein [Nonomuraea sp. SYSU D8015]|uniref:hypothetical protein n=1 Tax=Nonomuraea sp. SYSU D8015 TaxID=2593644 RepID=UPI001660119D|nr:hypothetical protein [Nonomuraea sp. SYSU D8015]
MIDFTVTPDNGEPYDVKAGSRDVLVWEKTSKGRSFQSLMNDLRMEDMYKLAHFAAKRQGLFEGTLKEFEETCELSGFTETEEMDPTQSVPSTGR